MWSFAAAGDIPTQEALAATALLREEFPDIKIRFINVVDLFKLEPSTEHSHGLTDRDFDSLFTTDKPVVFNFHGYPWLIHRLVYRRKNQNNPACARVQGEGQHQHADGAGDQQRDRSVQPGNRRDRSRSQTAENRRAREGEVPQPADRLPEHTRTNTASTPRRLPGGGGRSSEELRGFPMSAAIVSSGLQYVLPSI
jgi:hypothetical protein